MKYLNWKIGIALLTFLIGTTLTLAWLAFEPKIINSFDVSQRLGPLASEPPPVASTDPAYLKGRSDAERDVKDGKLIIIVEGQTRFEVILDGELVPYGVQTMSIGCFFKEQDVKHAQGYNEVSKAAIDARFGKGLAEEAIRRAAEQDYNYAP